MNARMKKSIAILLTAVMILSMAVPSFAAPVSSAKPAATGAEPAKVTGTWSTDAAGSWHFNAQDGAVKDGWYYLNTTNKATHYNWFHFANGVMSTGWVQDKADPSVWYYTGETKDSSEGGMVKGWVTDPRDRKKYYMDPATGTMRYGWQLINNVWYYFGEKQYSNASHPYGAMYVNEKTPDGYYVGSNGGWNQNNSEDDSDDPDPIPEYSITVETDGNGTASASAQKSAAGREITLTATPKEGYLFKEWNVVSGGVTVTGNKFTMPANNVTVQAVFEAVPETKKLSEILPSGFPTSADFAWVNADGKKAYKDGDNIKVGNLTLGADTTVTKSGDNYVCKSGDATVTFNVKDGAAESITVTGSGDSNGTYTAPPAPTEYTVTFDLNGITGTEPTSQTIKDGEKVTRPADPTDTFHTFAGWYKTKDATTGALSDPWEFDNGTVTADMTLYAQWTRTLESIYANSDIPKVTDNSAPNNAWVNGDGGKAFIANSTGNATLYLYKQLQSSAAKQLSCRKTENFTKIGDDYVLDYYYSGNFLGKYTLHMTDGKSTSVTYNGAGTDYEELSGIYEPAPPSSPTTLSSSPVSTGLNIEVIENTEPDAQETNAVNEIPDAQSVVYEEIAAPAANEVTVIEEVTEIKEEIG